MSLAQWLKKRLEYRLLGYAHAQEVRYFIIGNLGGSIKNNIKVGA
jgi:hypothetical protein